MRQRNAGVDFEQKRLLSIDEAAVYIGLGKTRTRETLETFGATVKIGKRVLFDKKVIDEALDGMRA